MLNTSSKMFINEEESLTNENEKFFFECENLSSHAKVFNNVKLKAPN